MILHGDELGRTQRGNNNVYCQDNELSWVDWDLDDGTAGAARVHPAAGRAAPRPPGVPPAPLLRRGGRRGGHERGRRHRLVHPGGSQMDADETGRTATPGRSRCSSTATRIPEPDKRGQPILDDSFLLIFNAHYEDLDFTLPRTDGGRGRHATTAPGPPTAAAPRTTRSSCRGPRRRALRRAPRADRAARRTPAPPARARRSGRRVSSRRREAAAAQRPQLPPPRPALPEGEPAVTRGTVPACTVRPRPTGCSCGRLRVRRRPPSPPPRGARRHARLPVPGPGGDARVPARVRRGRPLPAHDERAATPAFDRGRGAARARAAAVVGRRPQPHGGADPGPAQRRAVEVLRDGPSSPFARWFDVDWSVPDRAVLHAGARRAHRRRARPGQLRSTGPGTSRCCATSSTSSRSARAPRTSPLAQLRRPAVVPARWWRVARRRAELPALLRRRHAGRAAGRGPGGVRRPPTRCCSSWCAEGLVDGLRIDHPDGLADPRGYLRRLAEATGGVWVVVEKILEGDEQLPADWPCAGTTGTTPSGGSAASSPTRPARTPLGDLLTELTGEPTEFSAVVDEAKREVVEHSLYAEVNRLTDLLVAICHEDISLRDHTRRQLGRASSSCWSRSTGTGRTSCRVSRRPPRASRWSTRRREGPRPRPEDASDALELVRDLVLGRPAGRGPRRGTRLGGPSSSSGSSRPAGR